MILKKLGDEYKLYSHDSCIATTQESPHKRLSKENCDEIFGVIDVGVLALEECNNTDPLRLDSQKYKQDPYFRIGYLKGYNKAMELNKDKLFTEDQMWNMFYFGDSLKRKIKSGNIDNKPMGEIFDDYIKSLQQPTEIEVEMIYDRDCYSSAGWCDKLTMSQCIMCTPVYPLKDENGCLILKRK
jgi:hypothetical protein